MTMNTINEAFELLKKHKGLDMHCKHCELETPHNETINVYGAIHTFYRQPQLKITAEGTINRGSYTETYEIDYIIFGKDIEDGSLVDRFIKLIEGFEPESRQTLRLAWILANGYKYAVEQTQKKDHIDAGWHPRVVQYKTNVW